MQKLMTAVFGMGDVKFRMDDDFFDRLSRRHTTCLLLIFALVVTTKQYVGEPIHCWCPAHFTDAHRSYADTICWVKNTYYVPMEDDLPRANDTRHMISYYQWVPIILFCQSLLCYFPSLVWRFFCKRSGVHVSAIMEAATAGQRTQYADLRDKSLRFIVHHLDKYLAARVEGGRGRCSHFKKLAARYCCLVYGRFYGNYLCVCYMVIKFLYVLNAVGQLFLLDSFLGTNFHVYGLEVLTRFVSGVDWTESLRFPRVTMCNFKVRHMNVAQQYVLQCVLPINLFSEKIFLFIWIWFAQLAVLTVFSFIKWFWNLFFWPGQVEYVKGVLKSAGVYGLRKNSNGAGRFAAKYLKRDGVFLVRLIGNNVGHLVAADVMSALWDNYGADQGQMGLHDMRESAIRLNRMAENIEPV